MSNPNNFILSTDFASVTTSGDGKTTLTLPSNMSIAPGSTWTSSSDISLPGNGSIRTTISSSKIGSIYTGSKLAVSRNWSDGSSLTSVITAWRVNQSTVRTQISVFNYTSNTVNSPAGNEVFTVRVKNINTPFA